MMSSDGDRNNDRFGAKYRAMNGSDDRNSRTSSDAGRDYNSNINSEGVGCLFLAPVAL